MNDWSGRGELEGGGGGGITALSWQQQVVSAVSLIHTLGLC